MPPIFFNNSNSQGTINYTSLIFTGSYAPTLPTTSPVNETLFIEDINLSCSDSTDQDGDTIYYEFWNSTGLMQNLTNTTYQWTNLSIGSYE